MNGNANELKSQLLGREMAFLRRCLDFLRSEVEECAREIHEVEKERAAVEAKQTLINARPSSAVAQSDWFDKLSDDAFLRLADLVRTPRRRNAQGLLPFSSSTLWHMVADGRFPKPVKLSEGVTAWRVRDIRAWLCTRRD
ncbi:AlpA family phage regulatory protein [Variovorax sp. J22R133]|uniref:helix-turn-helix transcriptional regulator n=1 Tax=Variovorax brevis TaxID=3053503 RepID=UPI0025786462|nr:AlpA family phage regulatory protein [Variovorax sp. J22R133]MDM0117514.1 AlpA family phage regulatory protein [Variovorax sp. J22R133]